MFSYQSIHTTNENGYKTGKNVERFPNFVFNINSRYTSDTERNYNSMRIKTRKILKYHFVENGGHINSEKKTFIYHKQNNLPCPTAVTDKMASSGKEGPRGLQSITAALE
jgi:hypothetical protein